MAAYDDRPRDMLDRDVTVHFDDAEIQPLDSRVRLRNEVTAGAACNMAR